jgi:signal transduction histidine kinase
VTFLDPSEQHPNSEAAAVVAADWDQSATPLRGRAREIWSTLPQQRLQQLYAISRVLIRAEGAEASIREVLAILDQALPIRSAVFILGDRVPIWIVWSTTSVSADQLQAAKDFARGCYEYLLGAESLPYGQLAARLPGATPETPVESLDRRRLIRLPLVVEQRGSFGILQLEGAEPFTEMDLAFISAVTLDLAGALDRHHGTERRRAATEVQRADAEERQLSAEAKQVHAESLAQQARVERARADFGRAAAEAELAQSQRRVRTTEALRERYQALLDNIHDGFVWEADRTTLLVSYASAAVEGLLGFPPQRWLEQPGFLLDRLYPDDRAAVAQMLRDVPVAGGGRCEHRFVTAQGQVLWFQTGVYRAPETGSSADKLQGISMQISQAVRQRGTARSEGEGSRLQDALVEGRAAAQARDDLLATVSHDLKTPLNVILMTLGSMAGSPREQRAAKDLENLQRSAQRMDRLIRDLLDSARLEAGGLPMELELVSAARLAEEAFAALLPLAQNKGVQLKSTLVGEMPEVRADTSRIQQVLSNLISNAIKFTPAGGEVVLRAERSGRQVRFAVRDTGPGIAQSELTHLFERFWQAQSTAHLGTGLGLSIARGIVLAHGGRLWVESRLGVGSTFYFTLPVA